MKFIHCADLHLDSKMGDLPSDKSKARRGELVRTFERLAVYAKENQVKAVIIAGDMFDTARVTISTKDRVLHAIKNCSEVDFIYLSGNHDDVNFITSTAELPTNLKVVGDEWSCYDYDNVSIVGTVLSSLNSKTAYDTLSLERDRVNIVTLHGQVAGYNSSEFSELINIPALKDKNIDYLALGHIHSFVKERLDLRGIYAYAGCLDGRGFDELGDKGFVLIDVDGSDVKMQFVKFSSRDIYEVEFNVEGFLTWYEVADAIVNDLTRSYSKESLIKVVLTGQHKTSFYVDKDLLSQKLNERFFYAKVTDKTQLEVTADDYVNDKSVRGEFVRSVWESDISEEDKSKIILCGLKALKGEVM